MIIFIEAYPEIANDRGNTVSPRLSGGETAAHNVIGRVNR